ncbi:MAG: hypothetical protein OEW40_21885 [Cyclobacteriaceae bacterium]|jgi:hypothetical protein|nr:hypothetical protein [Cyclobacteriaceae bacterium]
MRLRPLPIFLILVSTYFASCSDDNPAASFASLGGQWIYTFPDDEVSIAFTIGGSDVYSYSILEARVRYGTLDNVTTGFTIDAPCYVNKSGDLLLSITFQLKPASPTSGSYTIALSDPVPNSTFTEIAISKATYIMTNNGSAFLGGEGDSTTRIKRK